MFCIGAIFKNEGPYILEWIAYHKAIGVDRFYIVDNISNDGSSELLCNLHSSGIITRIEYKNEPGIKPQLPAYKKIINNLKSDDKFIAFIDADEFLYPSDIDKGIEPLINVFSDPDIGAIALNWAIYGSSNCILPRSDSLVIELFEHRAVQNFPANNHYKSVIRKESLIDTGENAHYFKIDGKYVLSDLSDMNTLTGLSQSVSWDKCRINHYVIKSKMEFFSKKAARGRPSGKNSDLNGRFFKSHDINTVREQYPHVFISKVKDNIDNIKKAISYKSEPCDIQSLYRSSDNNGLSCIDSISHNGSTILISGWAVSGNKIPLSGIKVIINNNSYINKLSYSNISRHDVYQHGMSNDANCGFHISLDMQGVFVDGIRDIAIYALDGSGKSICEIDINKHKSTLRELFHNLS